MALKANAIISLTEIKAYLTIGIADATRDVLLEQLINSASDAIEREVNSCVIQQTFTDEIQSGSGNNFQRLLHRPITELKTPALADVQWRSAPDQDWQDLSSNIAFIILQPERRDGITLYDRNFIAGFNNIKISYKAGYVVIPEDVRLVCIEMVAEWYKEATEARLGRDQVSKNLGQGSTITDSFYELSPRHKAKLLPYRWQSV